MPTRSRSERTDLMDSCGWCNQKKNVSDSIEMVVLCWSEERKEEETNLDELEAGFAGVQESRH